MPGKFQPPQSIPPVWCLYPSAFCSLIISPQIPWCLIVTWSPNPQHLSQADKYLTHMAMTDPIKVRDSVRVLLKRSCLSPKDTRHKPCQYKPAPVQTSVQWWATSLGVERTCYELSIQIDMSGTKAIRGHYCGGCNSASANILRIC